MHVVVHLENLPGVGAGKELANAPDPTGSSGMEVAPHTVPSEAGLGFCTPTSHRLAIVLPACSPSGGLNLAGSAPKVVLGSPCTAAGEGWVVSESPAWEWGSGQHQPHLLSWLPLHTSEPGAPASAVTACVAAHSVHEGSDRDVLCGRTAVGHRQ